MSVPNTYRSHRLERVRPCELRVDDLLATRAWGNTGDFDGNRVIYVRESIDRGKPVVQIVYLDRRGREVELRQPSSMVVYRIRR